MKKVLFKIIENFGEDVDNCRENKTKWEDRIANIEFPTLEGSEKQIKWANDIKRKNVIQMIIDSMMNYFEMSHAKEGGRRYEHFKEMLDNNIEEIEKYINETSAKVIIETR